MTVTTFKNYNNQKDLLEAQEKIITLCYLANNQGLNEALLEEGVKDWLKKLGLSVVKSPSLIDYIDDFVSGAGTIILAAIQGDTAKIKAQMERFDVGDLIDFLHSLDNITLGIISAPLDLIQAVTGLDIKGSIDNTIRKTKSVLVTIKKALGVVKDNITKISTGVNRDKLLKSVDDLDLNLPEPGAIKV